MREFSQSEIRRSLLIALAVAVLSQTAVRDLRATEPQITESIRWGNCVFVNLSVGESVEFRGSQISLESVRGDRCDVKVDGKVVELQVARRGLPSVVGKVRIYCAVNRPVAELTVSEAFPNVFGTLKKDALLCLSDASENLLDADRFTFPIAREDGFQWRMSENSHMFAYLSPNRAHEGLDINMHDARGRMIHQLVAIEDGVVRWVSEGSPNEACVLLESSSSPGVFYIYQHLFRERVAVSEGDSVVKGETLGTIWGDGRWGHLHFAVIAMDPPPDYPHRYSNVLNCFPQLYELWNDGLHLERPQFSEGDFLFAGQYWTNGNEQHRDGYSDLLGYGWRLGDWCPAAKVETSTGSDVRSDASAVLRKTMFQDSVKPSRNPKDDFEFEVSVGNGTYDVRVELGDIVHPTSQTVGIEFGVPRSVILEAGAHRWVEFERVNVTDGHLTVRIGLSDEQQPAAIRRLIFTARPQ